MTRRCRVRDDCGALLALWMRASASVNSALTQHAEGEARNRGTQVVYVRCWSPIDTNAS